MRYPERKSLVCGKADGGFRMLLHRRHLATELMEHSRTHQGITQAEGMRNLLRQRHRRVVPRQCLVRIAQTPQCPSTEVVEGDILEHMRGRLGCRSQIE